MLTVPWKSNPLETGPNTMTIEDPTAPDFLVLTRRLGMAIGSRHPKPSVDAMHTGAKARMATYGSTGGTG